MGFTDTLGVSDVVTVELVTVPELRPLVDALEQPIPPEATPAEQSAEATIEQTGSGPPPEGVV